MAGADQKANTDSLRCDERCTDWQAMRKMSIANRISLCYYCELYILIIYIIMINLISVFYMNKSGALSQEELLDTPSQCTNIFILRVESVET